MNSKMTMMKIIKYFIHYVLLTLCAIWSIISETFNNMANTKIMLWKYTLRTKENTMNTKETDYQTSIENHTFVTNYGFRAEIGMGGVWYEREINEHNWMTLGGNTGTDDFENVIGSTASYVRSEHHNSDGEIVEQWILSDVLKDVDSDTIVDQEIAERFLKCLVVIGEELENKLNV